MKNIEGLSKHKKVNIPTKADYLIRETNQLLRSNIEDKVLQDIQKNFNKLLKYASFFSKKINTIDDFKKFLIGLEQILQELEIEKLYNNTTIKNIGKFSKLDLFKQFLYISTPIYNNSENLEFIKGGTCYNWSIFFYNLFNEIDKKNIFQKELFLLKDNYHHSAFLVGFKDKKFLIDPYAKKNGLITEIKKGNKIYLGAVLNELIFGEIIDEEKITLRNGKEIIKPKIYKTKHNFIKNISYDSILNIKTYINGESTQIIVKEFDKESLLINFDGNMIQREKRFIEDDIMYLYMEKGKASNYEILLAILGFKEELLNKKTKNKLKAIASKLNINYIFEKFSIQDAVEMFRNT